MKNINKDFELTKGKKILFLGHVASLSTDEIKLFLEKFNITYTKTLDENVKMVIESTLLSPYEEEIGSVAYQNKIPIYNTEEFEKLYAQQLNSNSLLMSLKLSGNQNRLTRLLHNPYLNDTLFIKLIAMYNWGNEGMFDNSENMKIATLLAKRFFLKNRFDPAFYHSPVSVFEIALTSDNPDLLEIMFDLPIVTIKQSRNTSKKPTTTREAIASNQNANQNTLNKLFRLNDNNIDYFLAQNPSLSHTQQERLFTRANDKTKAALTMNKNLCSDLFDKLTSFNTLWQHQKITKNQLCLLPKPIPHEIGLNEYLSPEIISLLLQQDNQPLLENLALNQQLTSGHIKTLFAKNNPKLYAPIAANPNTPKEILYNLFTKNDHKIDCHLALNTKTPQEMLRTLFLRDDFEINCHLSLNEALPVEWLQQLQIDTRLLGYLKENKTFTENILNNLGI